MKQGDLARPPAQAGVNALGEMLRSDWPQGEGATCLRAILDNFPFMVWLKRADGRFLAVNQVYARTCGADSVDRVVGRRDCDIWPPELADRYVRDDAEVAASGRSRTREELIDRQGRRYWYETYKKPVLDAAGELLGTVGFARDITASRATQKALRRSEERYRLLLDNIKEVVFQTDAEGHWLFLSRAWSEVTRFPIEDSLGRLCQSHIHPDDRDLNIERFRPLFARQIDFCRHRVRYLTRDGGYRWIEVMARLNLAPGGELLGTTGTLTDVTDQIEAEEQLRLSASVFANTHDGVMITDPDGSILDVNQSFSRLTGYTRDEVLGRNANLLKSGHQDKGFYDDMWAALLDQGKWQGEIINRKKNGDRYVETLGISAVHNAAGVLTHYVGVFTDITELKESQRRLELLAHYDPLTRLPNRTLLADRMRQSLGRARRQGSMVAVCYLDLDGFKPINDRHGHHIGDRLLIEVTERLRLATRAGDTVARLGGDEFVLLFCDLGNGAEVEAAVVRLLQRIAAPIAIDELALRVSGSVGATLYPLDGTDPDVLLRQADQAMYQAKNAGRGTYRLFDQAQDQGGRERQQLLSQVNDAFQHEQFEMLYQPKVDLRNARVVGVEALVRWRHPQQGELGPDRFLPMLVESGLANALDQWVVGNALNAAQAWVGNGLHLPLSINVRAQFLLQDGFLAWIRERVDSIGTGSGFELEILETAAFEDTHRIAQVMQCCRPLGIGFSLDDFGTGYSSLSYLKRLPVNSLKIDRSFVADLIENPEDLAIVSGIIGMARAFRLRVIAEGVETPAQAQTLMDLGCDVMQGFGIARPMPAAALVDWVREFDPATLWRSAGADL